jgi:hypothetical protein
MADHHFTGDSTRLAGMNLGSVDSFFFVASVQVRLNFAK